MQFSELAVDQKFKLNGNEFKKTEPQKVSCCKTLNAINLATNQKIMVKPNQDVEVVTE